MSKGPRQICMVKIEDEVGEHFYYAGTDDTNEAFEMALERGYREFQVTVKGIPNRFAIQHGEWRQAAP